MKLLVSLGLSLAMCVSFYQTVVAQIALQMPVPPVPLVGPRTYGMRRSEDPVEEYIDEYIDLPIRRSEDPVEEYIDPIRRSENDRMVDSDTADFGFREFENDFVSEDREDSYATDPADSSASNNDWISDSQMAEIGQIVTEEIYQTPATYTTDFQMFDGQIFIRKPRKQ